MPNSETASAHTFLSADEASALLDNASDVLLRASNDGDFEWVSQSVVDVLGFTPAQLIGTPVFNLVHPDDVQQLNGYQHGIEAGQPQRFELRLRHATAPIAGWPRMYGRISTDKGNSSAAPQRGATSTTKSSLGNVPFKPWPISAPHSTPCPTPMP